eukprot:TRINITY_DN15087_c0_g1_i1.p1 TRINITY_DN15087_c0_g1~~TRINITY_DN15087_c0_g1_i1.p1  ORF type:complete len:343 (-),score=64.97 TRINITY_DN15087_c0_g1_i1:28-1056(-)
MLAARRLVSAAPLQLRVTSALLRHYHMPARPEETFITRTGLIAKKKFMLSMWDETGRMHPITVLQVEKCEVVQQKTDATDGYNALQLGVGDKHPRRATKAEIGHLQKAKLTTVKRRLHEFRVSPEALLPVGFEINAAHFVPGQYVDVTGITTGKGFQGVMKRWGFSGLPASHGVSVSHRSHGSTGQRQDPGKVFKGKKMAGRMGGKQRTIKSLWIFKVDPKLNLIYVKGAVPGTRGNYVYLKDAVQKRFKGQPVARPFPSHPPLVEWTEASWKERTAEPVFKPEDPDNDMELNTAMINRVSGSLSAIVAGPLHADELDDAEDDQPSAARPAPQAAAAKPPKK